MKSVFNFFKKSLVPVLTAGLLVPAFGQTLTGDYKMIGRRCEDNKQLAPPDGSAQTMSFESDGSFRHTYFIINVPQAEEGGLTIEEHSERRRERRIARALEYFEEDKQTHESACRNHGEVRDEDGRDLCEPGRKRELYERWRSERMENVEKELERAEDEDKRFMESHTAECSMEFNGSYRARGNRLTVSQQDFSASEGCGGDASYPSRPNRTYYFEGRFLYLVQPADSNSRDYCGSSDWSEIWFRK